MLALGDIGNHGEAQKSHNAACLEDTHIGKIQEYKRYKNTDIRKIRGQQVSPPSRLPPRRPVSRGGAVSIRGHPIGICEHYVYRPIHPAALTDILYI